MRTLRFPERFDAPDLMRLIQRHLNPGAKALKAWAEEVRTRALERLIPTELVSGVVLARPGDLVRLDTSRTGNLVKLAPPTSENAGAVCAVLPDSPSPESNAYAVHCPGYSVNRHADEMFLRSALFVSDGIAGWWALGQEPLRWNDLRGNIAAGTGGGALVYEAAYNSLWQAYYMRSNVNDYLSLTFQMDHGWAKTSAHVHMHYWPEASGTGIFALDGYYRWVRLGDTMGAIASLGTAFAVTRSLTAADAHKNEVIELFQAEPPDEPTESTMLIAYVKRDSTGVDTFTANKSSGTPVANIGLLFTDCHIQVAEAGSYPEY